jgi:hypothetical protein
MAKTVHPAKEYLQYFSPIVDGSRRDAKPRRKRRRRTAVASRKTVFFVLRLGSRYCRCNFSVTHLTCLLFFAS